METDEIKFEQLLETVKTVNARDKTRWLGQAIDDDLEDLLQKVSEYKKEAELTIKIKIKPIDKNELNILGDIYQTKIPKGKIRQNAFYQDYKGGLYLDDPQQMKLLDTRKVENINERKTK